MKEIGNAAWQALLEIWNRKDNHDKALFSKLDAIMSEEKLVSMLDGLRDEMYWTSQSAIFDEFIKKISLTSFLFKNNSIETKRKTLLGKLLKLQTFRHRYFCMHHGNKLDAQDYRMVFRPDIKFNLDDGEYLELQVELKKLIDEVDASYIGYRKSVKNRLFV
jgi:hypothetical protein